MEFKTTWHSKTEFHRIVISPIDHNYLFAATDSGLYKSSNAADSWTEKVKPDDGSNKRCTGVAFSPDGEKVYAVGPASDYFPPYYQGIGYWVSTNAGSTFTQYQFTTRQNSRTKIEAVWRQGLYFELHVLRDFAMDRIIYTPQPTVVLVFPTELYIGDAGCNSGYNMLFGVNPSNSIIYVGLSNMDFWISTNGGNSFNSLSVAGHPDYHAIDVFGSNIVVGNDGGISKSTNSGNNWTEMLNADLTLAEFYKFSSSYYNPDQIAAGMQDMGMVYKSSGAVWARSQSGDGANVVCSETVPNIMVGNNAGSAKIAWYSNNGGTTFNSSSIDGWFGDDTWDVPFVSHPTTPGVFYCLMHDHNNQTLQDALTIYKSTNNGVSYSVYSASPTAVSPQQFAISKSNPNIMYATTGTKANDWHYVNGPDQIYKYIDNDPNQQYWYPLYHPSIIPDRYISALAVDPANENIVYLGLSGFKCHHLWKTSDGGSSWGDITGNLPDAPINDFLINYLSDNTKNVLVATDAGVYITSNEGEFSNWQEVAGGLPNTAATKLFYNKLSGLLRVGTFGRGVWEVQMIGQNYINTNMVLNSDANGTDISDDIIIGNGGHVTIANGCTLRFADGKKILVENGGTLESSSGSQITLTSSGHWAGIEFQNGSTGNLNNIDFQNTETPITIDYTNSILMPRSVSVNNCTIYSGTVQMISACNIYMNNNHFIYSTTPPSLNDAIFMNNCTSVNLIGNTTQGNVPVGFSISNSNPLIKENLINSNDGLTGISLDNCYSTTIKGNSISGFQTAVYLNNASPLMYRNEVTSSSSSALVAEYSSNPILRPSFDGSGNVIWNGGVNTLTSSNAGITLNYGNPDISNGINFINASNAIFKVLYYIYIMTPIIIAGITELQIQINFNLMQM